MPHVVVRVARNAGIVALFIVAAMLGILSGVLFAYAGDLPQVSALDNYSPSTITRIYSSGGQVIGEFATQRRVVVGYDDINPVLRNAIIATEDASFDKHFGLNFWRIFAAAAQRRAPAHGRRGLPHAGTGGCGQAEADRHARAAEPTAGHRTVFRGRS